MPDEVVRRSIEAARDMSVQQRADGNIPNSVGFLQHLIDGSYLVPGWWSEKRDSELRRFWKTSDHLSGAIYNMTSKMTAIPFRVVPKNPSNRTHRIQAQHMEDVLLYGAEYGEGWQTFYTKFIEDLLTQDNGAFGEIIGPGSLAGPIDGAPVSVSHLDAGNCQRTGDPEWPIIFRDYDGKRRKLHYTRVIYASQMSSPRQDMFGVGFSAVSRCLNVAQTLIDILTFKMEKLGSRPHRGILLTKGGLDPDEVADAFSAASSVMDTRGLSRFAMMVVLGSVSLPDADLELFELSSLPDGFDEETSIVFGMATIALALGVDARELFPAMSAGATRADALLQHIKQRGKGPGQIIGTVEQLFNFKFLPPHLRFVFDQQDDAEDRQSADISQVRATARESDLIGGVITVRTARQRMMSFGEINEDQFEQMELEDGRLVDGTSVLSLLYSDEPAVSEFLQFSSDQPDNPAENDFLVILEEVSSNLSSLHEAQSKTRSHNLLQTYRQVEAALNHLKTLYMQGMGEMGAVESSESSPEGDPRLSDRRPNRDTLNPNQTEELDSGSGLRRNNEDTEKQLEDRITKAIESVEKIIELHTDGSVRQP